MKKERISQRDLGEVPISYTSLTVIKGNTLPRFEKESSVTRMWAMLVKSLLRRYPPSSLISLADLSAGSF